MNVNPGRNTFNAAVRLDGPGTKHADMSETFKIKFTIGFDDDKGYGVRTDASAYGTVISNTSKKYDMKVFRILDLTTADNRWDQISFGLFEDGLVTEITYMTQATIRFQNESVTLFPDSQGVDGRLYSPNASKKLIDAMVDNVGEDVEVEITAIGNKA